MNLHRVHLSNIRSYTDAVIEFPSGTILLSGDIGSGKSTILHAIEFGLFGVLRGMLSGETLLRNGATEGKVSLSFSIEGKQVDVVRTLKRTKQGIFQDAACMTLDSVEQHLTATELKSNILELLGYPSELLSKSKGLIYRYTVYTPQEDMKRIIFDDPDIRLNTLRRVFDIDKYQRISENAKIYCRTLRETCKRQEGQVADLGEKRELLSARQSQLREVQDLAAASQHHLTQCKHATAVAAKAWEAHQKNITHLLDIRKRLAVIESEQRNLLGNRTSILQDLNQLQQRQHQIHEELTPHGASDTGFPSFNPDGTHIPAMLHAITNSITHTEQSITTLSQSLQQTLDTIRTAEQAFGGAKARHQHAHTLSERLARLDVCPTCNQPITSAHKHAMEAQEHQSRAAMERDIETHLHTITALEATKASLDEQLALLHERQRLLTRQQTTARQALQLLDQSKRLLSQSASIDAHLRDLGIQKSSLTHTMYPLEDCEHQAQETRKIIEKAQQEEKEAAVTHATHTTTLNAIKTSIQELTAEIAAKSDIRQHLLLNSRMLAWLDTGFLPLLSLIEQHVFATVYHQFNDAFTAWFSLLIEDNLMTARLDKCFAPVIIQNGYDLLPEHLSGGEKTSLALAYRLALNKVINDLHTTIKTRNLLILDEPTDGFSTEQLDRVRDVIRQLPVKQCIIVSHEPLVESFVDHILHITKQGHVSSIHPSTNSPIKQ